MMNQADIDAVTLEWWIGLLPDGRTLAPKFAKRWNTVRGRAYYAHLADLGAQIALIVARVGSSEPMLRRVMVSLAVGADGSTDLRVETQDYTRDANGDPLAFVNGQPVLDAPVITRWRPAAGGRNLDDGAIEYNGSTRAAKRLAERAALVAEAIAADAATVSDSDARRHYSELKRHRIACRERAEALALAGQDPTPAITEVAITEAKLMALRVPIDAGNEARKEAASGDAR